MLKTNRAKRILYIGEMGWGAGSTCWQRMDAMRRLGHHTTELDLSTPFAQRMQQILLFRALRKLFGIQFDWSLFHRRFLQKLDAHTFDAMWIDKGISIPPAEFLIFRKRFPNAKIIGYSPDDMMNPGNKTPHFLQTLPLYDHYFTTKSFHVKEFQELGCKNVHFVDNAYHAPLHRKVKLTPQERERFASRVVFLGAWEQERSATIVHLARNGIPIRVWGDAKWKEVVPPSSLLQITPTPVIGEDYTKALNASEIGLCFLRKSNRDLQTTRSVEIPACGIMMLAEHSSEHVTLFEPDKEAVFFSSTQELLEKLRYYLDHPEERQRIAEAGYQRCIKSGYSNEGRMQHMLSIAFPET